VSGSARVLLDTLGMNLKSAGSSQLAGKYWEKLDGNYRTCRSGVGFLSVVHMSLDGWRTLPIAPLHGFLE